MIQAPQPQVIGATPKERHPEFPFWFLIIDGVLVISFTLACVICSFVLFGKLGWWASGYFWYLNVFLYLGKRNQHLYLSTGAMRSF